MTLSAEEVKQMREALAGAKFALEQGVDGPEKKEALKKINAALDLMRKA
jgi:hypothetical protein